MTMIRIQIVSILLLIAVDSSSAGLIVTIANTTLTPGETALVDVFIRSDNGTDQLAGFSVDFHISTAGSTLLEFTPDPPDPHLTNPDYIFFDNSAAALFPLAGAVSTTKVSYVGVDAAVDFSGVPVPKVDTLLTTLEITTNSSSPPQPGDSFSLTLVPPSNPPDLSDTTYFLDADYADLPVVDIQNGTITILDSDMNAVPEPTSIALALFGTIALLGYTRFCRKSIAS